MPSRRQYILTGASLLAGGAALGSSASGMATSSPSADFQVLAPPGLRLEPGREDRAHVEFEEIEGVEHVTAISTSGVNARTRSSFVGIVEIVNEMDADVDELYFEFEVEAQQALQDDITGAISIVSGQTSLAGSGETNLLELRDAPEGDPDVLGPDEAIPFGLVIDLQSSNPDTEIVDLPDSELYDVTIRISANTV